MTIVLLATLYVTIVPLYFFEANLRNPKKNIILGVTVPHTHQLSAEVQQITDAYLKRLRIVSLVFALLGLSMLFVPYMSIQLTIVMTLILGVIVGTSLVYIQANRRLMALKRSAGWQGERKAVAVTDLRAMEEKGKPLPRVWLAVPTLIAAIPLIPIAGQFMRGEPDWPAILSYGVTVIIIPLMLVMAEAFRRQNAEIVGTISDLNVITTRIRRQAYMRMTVLTVWLLAATAVGTWFQFVFVTQPQFLIWAVVIILSIVVGVYAIRAEFAVRRAQEKFTQLAGDTLDVDTDEYWIWGMFYYNRADKRIIINERVGMNMSMNLAHPISIIGMGFAAIALLAMPLIGVWMMAEEFTPITYSVEGNVVTATHLWNRQFNLGDEFETELLDEFPGGMRTNGTALGTLRRGRFQLNNIGATNVLLKTDDLPLILIRTADGANFLFSYAPAFTPLRNAAG